VADVTINLKPDDLAQLVRRVVEETLGRLESRPAAAGTAETAAGPVFLLRPREAARALAISERTLWELTRRGEIPHVRLGRAVRYRPADLDAWAEARKQSGLQKEANHGKHFA
jgi:excisionase family DNA binding protein